MKKPGKTLINLPVSDYGFRIELSKVRCGGISNNELAGNAIEFFRWAMEEARQGKRIASLDKERQRWKEANMPALRALQEASEK